MKFRFKIYSSPNHKEVEDSPLIHIWNVEQDRFAKSKELKTQQWSIRS